MSKKVFVFGAMEDIRNDMSVMRIVFSESVVFHKCSGCLPWLCLFGLCLCLGFVCFGFGRHLAFCFSPVLEQRENIRKLGTRILLPPALLSKQQDSPQLPQWIVNPFRTTQAHQTRSVLFT